MNPDHRPRGVLALSLANLLAWAGAGGAALLYARNLQPAEFAHWTLALACARGSLLLLDGGLKTALVRRARAPDAALLQRLRRNGLAVAAGLMAAWAAAAAALAAGGRMPADAAALLLLYPAAYLLPYPWLLGALARLERAQQFGPVGRAEGVSVLLEFTLPAALLAAGLPWWLAFALAAALSRLLRSVLLVRAARRLPAAADAGPTPSGLRRLLRDGLGVQAVAALSLLRDHVHLWWVGPLYGAAWAGHYGFALNACALVGQVCVQTAARIALPRLRAAPPHGRWPLVLASTRTLAICALPPLALLPVWLAWADAAWWQSRWQPALALVPLLALRMLPSVATTLLGAWLMAAQSPAHAVRAHARWTVLELLLALAATAGAGPHGLALAWSCGAWIGLAVFVAAAQPGQPWVPRALALTRVLLLRPSLALALGLALLASRQPQWLGGLSLALPLVWLAEPTLWPPLRRLAARAAGLAPAPIRTGPVP